MTRDGRRKRIQLESLEARALLTVFSVTNNSNNPATVGSLPYAVANLATGNDPSTNTITISSTLAGGQTISLASPLTLTQGVTINGPGANLVTVDGGGSVQDFIVSSGVSAVVSGLTVSRGDSAGNGGAFENLGMLDIEQCYVTGSSAVAGGAVFSDGPALTIGQSTIAGNTSAYSTVEGDAGTLTITNSTIANNAATNNGGTFASGAGLALYSASGSVSATLENDTFFGNTAADADSRSANDVLIDRLSATGYSATITVEDDIFASSLNDPTHSDFEFTGAAFGTSHGYNITSDGSGPFSVGDLLNTNPQLGPLTSNGGGVPTAAPLLGSPAINRGPASNGLSVDERGFTRPVDGAVDSGAFENQLIVTPPSPATVTATGNLSQSFALGAFTDSAPNSGPYRVVIDWGDSTNSTITASSPGSLGSLAHTYTTPGNHTVTLVVNDTLGDINRAQFFVEVPESLTPGPQFNATEGEASSTQTVATFTDLNTPSSAFSATINWGDGSSATVATVANGGIVANAGGSYSIVGMHSYGEEGQYAIGTTVTVNGGPASNTATSLAVVADPSVIGSGVTLSPIPQGVATGAIALATFTDPGGAEPNAFTAGEPKLGAHYSATINWGDGTSGSPDITPASITYGGAPGSTTDAFTVSGASHIYYAPGDYTIAVTINHESSPPTVVYDEIVVNEQDLISIYGTSLTGNPGQPLTNVTVGSFTDGYPFTNSGAPASASSYTAAILWGDGGSYVPLTITPDGHGGYNLTGSHTYTSPGDYGTTLFVAKNGSIADDSHGYGAVVIAPTSINTQGATGSAIEGTAYTGPVATITSNDDTLQASNFAAVINWGNGVVQTATITGSNGSFTVSGSHVFADEGTYKPTVKVIEPVTGGEPVVRPAFAPTTVVQVTGTVNVQEADVLTPHGLTIVGTSGALWSGTVATFSDSYTANTAGDFSATINWGDGAITQGTVSGGDGLLSVLGSHTFTRAGTFKAIVTLHDDAPGTATAMALTQFNVSGNVGAAYSTTAPGLVVVPTSVVDTALSQWPSTKKS